MENTTVTLSELMPPWTERASRTTSALEVLFATVALAAGCGKPTQIGIDPKKPGPPQERAMPQSPRTSDGVIQRRVDFLNRIRAADAQYVTIQRALMNEKDELGIILSRQTNLDDIPKLMKSLLAQMDTAFPGENHTIVAYTPTEPSKRIGTARFDARTSAMTYTRESP